MRVLAVPNWSFAREKLLGREFARILGAAGVSVHACEGDVDHNRTVTAFSGEIADVLRTLRELQNAAFAVIDLNRHVGVHPRIGALDVCPFVRLDDAPIEALNLWVHRAAREVAERWDLPVFLYEHSEMGRHEADLPSLRKGGFGGLLGRELNPDFGPRIAHPRLGVTVMGARDFLIAMNVNLQSGDLRAAKAIARRIRDLRADGDPRFLGVRALGLLLPEREQCQVSLNVTLPDLTPPDPIILWITREAAQFGIALAGTELIGVIRESDLPGATRLPIRGEQVVPGI
ncbi:MAG: hypothetical protein ACOYON_09065 [Fimbriimonas sp.]